VIRVTWERQKDEGRIKKEQGSTESRPTEERKSSRLVRYSCWCPKVMAAIGRLPETLADRCIVITMQRKMGTDSCESMRELKAEVLRERCARFVEENATRIRVARPEIPKELNDRAADIWEPLVAIADLAGGEWPSLARAAAVRLSSGDEEITLLGWFLRDVSKVFAIKKREQMFSREIVDFLDPLHSRPWEELRRGRHINEWWLSQQLRAAGIRSRFVRIDGVAGRGYGLSEIEQAAKRYVPQPKEEG
jgi:putative DNA primase/helicase